MMLFIKTACPWQRLVAFVGYNRLLFPFKKLFMVGSYHGVYHWHQQEEP